MGHLNFFVGNSSFLDDVFSKLENDLEVSAQQRRGGPLIDAGSWTLRLKYHGDICAVSLKFNDALGKADLFEPLTESDGSLLYRGQPGSLGLQVLTLKRIDTPLARRLLERPLHTAVVEQQSTGIASELGVHPDAFSSITRSIPVPRPDLAQGYDLIIGLVSQSEWYKTRQHVVVSSYPTVVRS